MARGAVSMPALRARRDSTHGVEALVGPSDVPGRAHSLDSRGQLLPAQHHRPMAGPPFLAFACFALDF